MNKKKVAKKILSIALIAALLGSGATVLPAVVPESGIIASAALVYENFEYIVQNDVVTITKYTGSEEEVTIPSTIDGYAVKYLRGTFSSNKTVKKVTIPSGIVGIGDYTFNSCINLTDISFPGSVETINNTSFTGCSDITIYCEKGSAAQTFAEKNNIKYEILLALENNSSISSDRIYTGEKVTINAASAGGITPYTYSYLYKLSTKSTWNRLSDGFVSDTQKSLKLGKAGDYEIRVIVMDSEEITAEKIFKINVL